MMEEIDELRTPTAWRLLEIWRETRESAEDALERGLLCNAQVLERLTAGEMEALLRRLMGEPAPLLRQAENPAFDLGRYTALKET